MRRPGEDYHGFRALAERSVLADLAKDSAVATQVPGWRSAGRMRWMRNVAGSIFVSPTSSVLRQRFGVGWVVIERPGVQAWGVPTRMVLYWSVECLS